MFGELAKLGKEKDALKDYSGDMKCDEYLDRKISVLELRKENKEKDLETRCENESAKPNPNLSIINDYKNKILELDFNFEAYRKRLEDECVDKKKRVVALVEQIDKLNPDKVNLKDVKKELEVQCMSMLTRLHTEVEHSYTEMTQLIRKSVMKQ